MACIPPRSYSAPTSAVALSDLVFSVAGSGSTHPLDHVIAPLDLGMKPLSRRPIAGDQSGSVQTVLDPTAGSCGSHFAPAAVAALWVAGEDLSSSSASCSDLQSQHITQQHGSTDDLFPCNTPPPPQQQQPSHSASSAHAQSDSQQEQQLQHPASTHDQILLQPGNNWIAFQVVPTRPGLYFLRGLIARLGSASIHISASRTPVTISPSPSLSDPHHPSAPVPHPLSLVGWHRSNANPHASSHNPIPDTPAPPLRILLQVDPLQPRMGLSAFAAGGSLVAGLQQWIGILVSPLNRVTPHDVRIHLQGGSSSCSSGSCHRLLLGKCSASETQSSPSTDDAQGEGVFSEGSGGVLASGLSSRILNPGADTRGPGSRVGSGGGIVGFDSGQSDPAGIQVSSDCRWVEIRVTHAILRYKP